MARVGYKKIEVSTDYDPSLQTGTFTEIPLNKIPKEGFNPGDIESFTSETADLHNQLDGHRWTGNLRHEEGAAGIPAAGTPFWIKVTPVVGVARVYGGLDGATGYPEESGIRSLDSGRLYVDYPFIFVAATSAVGITD